MREFINNPGVTAEQIAALKGATQDASTARFGAVMQAGNLGLPREAYGDAFRVTFAKRPKLIPINLEILEAGAQATRCWRWRRRGREGLFTFSGHRAALGLPNAQVHECESMSEMDLKEGKSGVRKLESPVWRTYGIFKVDPETAIEIADSEDLYYLDE